jgi:hypothetical protein
VVGLDFGRSPAAVFMQAVNNRVLVQHELIGANEGAEILRPKVKRFLTEHYAGFTFRCFGDPKGAGQGPERRSHGLRRLSPRGMPVQPPPRLEAEHDRDAGLGGGAVLNEMSDARPRFVLSPICRTLKVGMAGATTTSATSSASCGRRKDRYSHPCDALQYGVLGLGEGRRMIGLTPSNQ